MDDKKQKIIGKSKFYIHLENDVKELLDYIQDFYKLETEKPCGLQQKCDEVILLLYLIMCTDKYYTKLDLLVDDYVRNDDKLDAELNKQIKEVIVARNYNEQKYKKYRRLLKLKKYCINQQPEVQLAFENIIGKLLDKYNQSVELLYSLSTTNGKKEHIDNLLHEIIEYKNKSCWWLKQYKAFLGYRNPEDKKYESISTKYKPINLKAEEVMNKYYRLDNTENIEQKISVLPSAQFGKDGICRLKSGPNTWTICLHKKKKVDKMEEYTSAESSYAAKYVKAPKAMIDGRYLVEYKYECTNWLYKEFNTLSEANTYYNDLLAVRIYKYRTQMKEKQKGR